MTQIIRTLAVLAMATLLPQLSFAQQPNATTTPAPSTPVATPATASAPITVVASEAVVPAAAALRLPKPFKSTYKTRLYGIKLTATRELKQQDDGRWLLRFDIDSWVAELKERSLFNWTEAGHAITHRYEYHRTGLAPDRHVLIDFDWVNGKVANKLNDEEDWRMDIPPGTLDKLNATMQIRTDLLNNKHELSYDVADGGKLKNFSFAIVREEVINTPVGKLNTVVVKTLRKNKKRETYMWFAKDWDYVLARISQKEPDGDSASIDIQEGWVDGQKIKGH